MKPSNPRKNSAACPDTASSERPHTSQRGGTQWPMKTTNIPPKQSLKEMYVFHCGSSQCQQTNTMEGNEQVRADGHLTSNEAASTSLIHHRDSKPCTKVKTMDERGYCDEHREMKTPEPKPRVVKSCRMRREREESCHAPSEQRL